MRHIAERHGVTVSGDNDCWLSPKLIQFNAPRLGHLLKTLVRIRWLGEGGACRARRGSYPLHWRGLRTTMKTGGSSRGRDRIARMWLLGARRDAG